MDRRLSVACCSHLEREHAGHVGTNLGELRGATERQRDLLLVAADSAVHQQRVQLDNLNDDCAGHRGRGRVERRRDFSTIVREEPSREVGGGGDLNSNLNGFVSGTCVDDFARNRRTTSVPIEQAQSKQKSGG